MRTSIHDELITCRFCEQNKKPIKAHIIPKFFFNLARDEKDPYYVFSGNGKRPKKSWMGIYDTNILCQKCDNALGNFDNYARQFFTEELDDCGYFHHNGKPICHVGKKFDYKKLKLFCISVLWRASISTREEFKSVDLGIYENDAKEMLRQENPGTGDDFSLILSKYDQELTNFMPWPIRLEGINFYRFFIPNTGYEIFIKVDKRKMPAPIDFLKLKQFSRLLILCSDFKSSKVLETAKDLLRKNQKEFPESS